MSSLLFALWFFLPAGIANVVPVLVAQLPGLRRWNQPVDGGHAWRGKRVFGDHKTWRGLVAGVAAGILVLWLQTILYDNYHWAKQISGSVNYGDTSVVGLGFALSFGALAGDMIESFFKRQAGVPSGRSWFPFDQLDYIVGGLLLSRAIVQLSLTDYVYIVVVWFSLHLLFSYLGYLMHFKEQPV